MKDGYRSRAAIARSNRLAAAALAASRSWRSLTLSPAARASRSAVSMVSITVVSSATRIRSSSRSIEAAGASGGGPVAGVER